MMGEVEKSLRLLVNVIACIFYLLIIWAVYFNGTTDDLSGGYKFFMMMICFVVVLVVQKILAAVFGSMGSAFDGTVGEIGKKDS